MSDIITLEAAALSQRERFKYLLGSIGPRPICFASTVDKGGKVNLSPYSFFNAFSSSPPILVFSAARNRDGEQKHTFQNIREVPEVVINVVNFPIVEQQSLASTTYDKGVNEFVKSGLTQVTSTMISPPRVGESPAAFECKVIEVKEFGHNPGAGTLIICEVIMIHMQKHYLDDQGYPDATKLDLVGRMGGNWYARASKDALFEIIKPVKIKGIGIDRLPDKIRLSDRLSGNDLGKLGGIEHLPSKEEALDLISNVDKDEIKDESDLVTVTKELLLQGESKRALALLMIKMDIY